MALLRRRNTINARKFTVGCDRGFLDDTESGEIHRFRVDKLGNFLCKCKRIIKKHPVEKCRSLFLFKVYILSNVSLFLFYKTNSSKTFPFFYIYSFLAEMRLTLLSFRATMTLFSIDSSPDLSLIERDFEYQSLCMIHAIRGLPQYDEQNVSSAENRDEFEVNDNTDDPCKWFGVTCRDKAVYGILWTWISQRDGEIQVEWLPSSVHTAYISDRFIDAPLETRTMPMQTVVFRMEACGLNGSIDLENLPPYLEVLSLTENHLSGSVMLRKLPPSIAQISLEKNSIEYVYVDNSKLPKSLETVKLKSRCEMIAATVVNQEQMDERILLR